MLMVNAEEILFEECGKKNVDWKVVNECVAALESSINDKDKYGDTFLSNAIKECGAGDAEQPRLIRLIQTFLDHGYHLNANNHYNGGVCLHALCWSTYTSEILGAAEFLLDKGADPFCSLEDEVEEKGVLDSISWKLGYWTVGDLSCANLFEAYYAMIKAAQDGEDYHGIHTISKCIGKVIKKVEQLSFSDEDKRFNRSYNCYKGAYIIWCDTVPLVVRCDVDFVVNPLAQSKAIDRIDRSEEFGQVIGKTIENLIFLSANIAELQLDDGGCMVFGNNYMGNHDDYYAHVEYRPKNENELPVIKTVRKVLFRSGTMYSESCRSYSEDMVFLDCDDDYYMISSIGEDYSAHKLICRKFSKDWFPGLKRTLKYENFCFDQYVFNKDNTLRGIQLHSNDRLLYVLATEFSGVKVMLEPKAIENPENVQYYSKGSKIEFVYR